MFRRIQRALLHWWLWRKFGPMMIGSQEEIETWVQAVVNDRLPLQDKHEWWQWGKVAALCVGIIYLVRNAVGKRKRQWTNW